MALVESKGLWLGLEFGVELERDSESSRLRLRTGLVPGLAASQELSELREDISSAVWRDLTPSKAASKVLAGLECTLHSAFNA